MPPSFFGELEMDEYQKSIDTFDRNTERYQEKYLEFDFYTETFTPILERLTTPDAKVLDLGCGPGSITKFLLHHMPDLQVTGIDAAPAMIELARENCPSAVFEVRDVRDLGGLPVDYGAIVCGFCVPYLNVENVRKLLEECRVRLVDRGFFYISVIEGEHGSSKTLGPEGGDQVVQYYYGFEGFQELLSGCGFDVVKAERKRYPADDPDVEQYEMFFYANKV